MRLQRIWRDADEQVSLGAMRDDDGKVFWTTFEHRPIPAGVYTCRLLDHPLHGVCWEVCDVPGRSGILFHVGNDADDSEGCVLLGFGFAERAITFSALAYNRFRRFLAARTEFTLTVLDPAL